MQIWLINNFSITLEKGFKNERADKRLKIYSQLQVGKKLISMKLLV